MFGLIIFIVIFIIYIYSKKTRNEIKSFNLAIIKAKENFISDAQLKEFQIKYMPLFFRCSKKIWKSKEVKAFILTFNNLDKKVIEWNSEFQEKEFIKKEYKSNIQKTKLLNEKIANFTQNYFTTKDKEELKNEFSNLYNFFTSKNFKSLHLPSPEEFLTTYENIDYIQNEYNSEYLKNENEKYKAFFSNIDGKSLDSQQRTAVITDDTYNLIIAGAGSGKTFTIAAKVKYLVEKKNIKPEEILLISFTNKAAEEMTNRIQNKLNIPLTAQTFHKLGLSILNKYQPVNILNNIEAVISEYFKTKILEDFDSLKNIFQFFLFYLNVPKNLEDFDSLGSYIDTQRTLDLETLKSKYDSKLIEYKIKNMQTDLLSVSGEYLKSVEEVMIANYLFLNGINYEYEKEYPFKSEDQPNRTYHPDFYLPDYDIYLEHFGITKDNTLPWLSKSEEQKYLKEMQWKRDFHKKNGTKLLETYSYYNSEKRLLSELQKLLAQNNVKSQPRDIQEIYKKVYATSEDYHFKKFEKLILSFINLYKANGYTIENINNFKKYDESQKSQRNNSFIDIIKPILNYYNQKLHKKNAIDFNDMINQATDYIKSKNIYFNYKYIIIDEYQDISVGRYKLIKEIINHSNAKLICVGDDWQSIYRFSGSDLNLFSSFEHYFGPSTILRIEKTYRNSQELLNIASKFILQNPEQLKKNLRSDKHILNPIIVVNYYEDLHVALHNALTDIYSNFGENAEILLLGRTTYDINIYINKHLQYSPSTNIVKYTKYPSLKIKFLTIHSSKGIEADNVIILNMKNHTFGFPTKICDDEVLSLVLQKQDSYEYAEERRLFYVALTRTKNRTYLIAPKLHSSIFLEDLKSITELHTCNSSEDDFENINFNYHCPKCKNGYLTKRKRKAKILLRVHKLSLL